MTLLRCHLFCGNSLADISLPDQNGLEFIKNARAVSPRLLILVISMHDETIYAERVLRAGGRGYIMKQEGGKKLLTAIRQVLGGQISVSEKIAGRLLESFCPDSSATHTLSLENLGDREIEVLQLLGEGKSTAEISQHLHLSPKTVEVHRANIRHKLGLKTASELVRYAVRWLEARG